jgi:hypothetical protein
MYDVTSLLFSQNLLHANLSTMGKGFAVNGMFNFNLIKENVLFIFLTLIHYDMLD